jgi:hypothetical protein
MFRIRRSRATSEPTPATDKAATDKATTDQATTAEPAIATPATATPATDEHASETHAQEGDAPDTVNRQPGPASADAGTATAEPATGTESATGATGVTRRRTLATARLRRAPAAIGVALRSRLGVLVSVVAAVLLLLGAVGLGPVDGTNTALIALGFDPDRAQLIAALIVGGAAAVVACLCGGVRWAAVGLGFAAMVALFATTFVRETQDAMAATGASGAFDPIGWGETLLALVVVGLLTAWACATCATPVRRELVATARILAAAVRQRHLDRSARTRLAATLVIVGLLALTLPVAGDLLNYSADDRMTSGGPPRQGLVPNAPGAPGEVPSLDASAMPSGDSAPASATASASTGP